MTSRTPSRPFNRFYSGLWLVPLLLALLANFNVLKNGFGWDDELLIQTPRAPAHFWAALFPDSTDGSAAKLNSPYYRPLVDFSYRLDGALWGSRPFGFHLSVLAAHLLNTLMVFFLARALAGGDRVQPFNYSPLLAASLFAVHPVHAEAVAWIAGRNDVFCATFMLASILLYIRFHRTGRALFFGLSMLAYALALFTKETAAGLFLLFPLFEFLTDPAPPVNAARSPRKLARNFSTTPEPEVPGSRWRRFGIRTLPPLLILGLYGWLRNHRIEFHYDSASQPTMLSHLAGSKWSDALGAFGLYAKLLVFPYPHRPFIATIPASFPVLISAALLGGVLLAALVWAIVRRETAVTLGFAWLVVTLLPALFIALFGFAATPAAERYLYSPSAGFMIGMAGLLTILLNRFPAASVRLQSKRWLAVGLLVIPVIGLWGWTCWNRNTVWRNSLSFWQAAVSSSPTVGYPYRQLGREYAQLKQSAEVERLYKQAVNIDEASPLPAYQGTAKSLQVLAEFYFSHRRYSEAEPLFKRALAIREIALRPDHPDLANSLDSLGVLYQAQGRYSEAEPIFQRSLSIREKAAGPEHPFVAAGLSSLAGLYYVQHRYAEAEPLYRRALKIREKALDPDSPDVAASLNNLATLYYAQGRYSEAEPFYRRSVDIRKKSIGPDHPFVAVALNNLAGLYTVEGKYAEAEPLYLQAIAIDEKNGGPGHPNVAIGLNNLAGLYIAMGKPAQAEPLYRRAIEIREKTLRPNHPDLATSLENYAALLHKMHRDAEAAPLTARARAIREKAAP